MLSEEIKPGIHFHYLTRNFSLRERGRLKGFILKLVKSEKRQIRSVNVIFCLDRFLLEINKTHLKHNSYTDIVTFPYSAKEEPIVADIYISIERVRENAAIFGATFREELHRVIFHGFLHLCGLADKTTRQAQQMRSRENHYLHQYFVPRGTGKL